MPDKIGGFGSGLGGDMSLGKMSGINIRKPFQGEMEFFKLNPSVSGMAAEDGSVVINPFISPDINRDAVLQNEVARAFMRKHNIRPNFAITPDQQKFFDDLAAKGIPGERDEQDIRETIVGRILSGDPSAGEATPEQKAFSEKLSRLLKSTF